MLQEERGGGLLLRPDIYSLTFYGFMKDDHDQKVLEKFQKQSVGDNRYENIKKVVKLLRQQRNSSNLYNSVVLFFIQIILLFVLAFTTYLTLWEPAPESYNLLLTQAICSLLLHLSLYQKLQRSVEKMIFLQENPARFDPMMQPYMIAHM